MSQTLARIFETYSGVEAEMSSMMISNNEILIERITSEEPSDLSVKKKHFTPIKMSTSVSNSHLYLTKQGILVEMTSDLIKQHSKFISRIENPKLKIFSIGKNVKDLSRGVTLRSKSIFTIAQEMNPETSEQESHLREAESIQIVMDVMNRFSRFFSSNIIIEISHSHLLSLLANRIGIKTIEEYSVLCRIASDDDDQPTSKKNEQAIWNLCKSSQTNVQLVNNFFNLRRLKIEVFISKIKKLFELDFGDNNIVDSIIDNINRVYNLLSNHIYNDIEIEFSTSNQIFSNLSFHSGIVFRVLTRKELQGKKQGSRGIVELGYGGRFDNMIESYKPQQMSNRTFACAAVVRSSEIQSLIRSYSEDFKHLHIEIDLHQYMSCVVLSLQDNMSEHIYDVSIELRKNNIKCYSVYATSKNMDRLMEHHKKRGISFVISLKKSVSDSPSHNLSPSNNNPSNPSPYRCFLRYIKTAGREVEMSLNDIVLDVRSKQFTLDCLSKEKKFNMIDQVIK